MRRCHMGYVLQGFYSKGACGRKARKSECVKHYTQRYPEQSCRAVGCEGQRRLTTSGDREARLMRYDEPQ